jgi:hypothetical protein
MQCELLPLARSHFSSLTFGTHAAMASHLMDWTPTYAPVLQNAPDQGIKRTHDHFNQQPQPSEPYNPYAGQYIPGGWPVSPGPHYGVYEDRTILASPEATASPPRPNIIVRAAKRICLGIASRLPIRKTTQSHRTEVNPMSKRLSRTPSSSPRPAISKRLSSVQLKTPESSALSTFLSSNVPSTPDLSDAEDELGETHMRHANQRLMEKLDLARTVAPEDSVGEDFKRIYLRCANPKLLRKLGLMQSPTPPDSPKEEALNEAPSETGDGAMDHPPSSLTPPATPTAGGGICDFIRPAAEVILRSPYPKLIPSLSLRSPFKFGNTSSPNQHIANLPASTPDYSSQTASQPSTPLALSQTLVSPQRQSICSPASSAETSYLQRAPSVQLLADMSRLSTRDQSRTFEAQTPDPYKESPASPPMSGELSVEQQRRYATRSLAKQKAEAAKQLSGYHIVPLSKEWEAKVEYALKHGHGSYTTHDLIKVVPPAGSKTTSQWLNDETVNGYLKLVTDLGNQGQKAGATPKYHAFTSFFMTTLLEKGYEGIKRWSKRAKIDGKKLYDVQDVFIPINRHLHWTVLVVSPKNRTIRYYDSLGGNGREYVVAAVQWLKGELGVAFAEGDWMIETAAASPMQNNSSDCGVFAITTAKQLMLGRSPMAYSASEIPVQRRRIVAELVAGKLL